MRCPMQFTRFRTVPLIVVSDIVKTIQNKIVTLTG